MLYKRRPTQHSEGLDTTLITITGLLILLVFALALPPRSSAGGNAKGKIAFVRGSGTAQEIYVMNADGSAQTRVTNNAVEDYFPVISPNGAKIAFESERNGNRDIYVIDPDGTNEQRLTTTPGVDLHPAWSPDGKQIAFSSDQNGNRDIYVMNADGTNQQRRTIDPAADLHPVYSPDGTKIAFASERDGDREICVIGANSVEAPTSSDLEFSSPSSVIFLTRNKAFDNYPAWSPDGTKLVFHSNRDGNFEIYTMNADGSNQTNVSRSSTEDIFPNWSPDGTKIVFESLRNGNRDVYTMDANGNNVARLTTNAESDLIPSWHWERTSTNKSINGRVRDINGVAVANVNITVTRKVDAAANCTAFNTSITTAANGTYTISVSPGCTYTIAPTISGSNGRSDPISVDVFVAFNVANINFVAGTTPTPSIRGRVIDDSKCPNYDPVTTVEPLGGCGLPGVLMTGEWSGETRTDITKQPTGSDQTGLKVGGTYTLPFFLINSQVTVKAMLPGYVITIINPQFANPILMGGDNNGEKKGVDFKAVRVNSAPAVALTDPANGTTYPAAAQVTINANASDADGSISKVAFFQGNTKLGETSSLPYSFNWNGVAPGNYSLTAVATDNGGASTTSSSVNITVNKANQTITFNALASKTFGDAAFNINASSSSGLPISFSIVSGPASVSGNTVTITGVGTVTVRASQPGDANYNAATPVDRSFTVEAGTFQPVVLTTDQVELKTWTFQGRSYAYVKLLFPNAGYRVVNWGQPVRSVNDFSADAAVEKFTGASVQVVTTTAQIYDLGPLAAGNYTFAFKNSGTVVKSLIFAVSSTTPPPNPIDDARQFVKQQYRDFLNREADQAGEDYWTDNITKCSDPARRPAGQTEAQCTLRQRETTSGAFFRSPEFQYTGDYVLRMYKGALGRQPKLSEFTPDAQFVGAGIIVNGQLSAAKINQNKADFAQQFVNCTDPAKYRCAEFKMIYDGLNNQQYVDKLFQTTGVNASASDRTVLVNGLNGGTETRASVLQKVVDGIVVIAEGNQQFTTTYGQAFYNSESNRAFVQLEYFGYMKRDPDDAGYTFWLGKLNQFNGNFVNAEMVLAFISSPEYRARFGQP